MNLVRWWTIIACWCALGASLAAGDEPWSAPSTLPPPPVERLPPLAVRDAPPTPPLAETRAAWLSDGADTPVAAPWPEFALPAPVRGPSPELIAPGLLGSEPGLAPEVPVFPAVPVVPTDPDFVKHYGGKARAYYLNDQRLEFTGGEATFAVEGVLDGGIRQRVNDWDLMVEGEFFFNQPFDRNILIDTPMRQSFASNFDIDPFEISQLFLAARKNDFLIEMGRFVTPFGRFYYPMYLNNFSDSPFIRSEAILYRETGLLVQWDPGIWVFQAALVNGGFNQDTNSSKGLIARAGIDQPWFALGTSIKWQDGVGSESQKQYNNHIGADAMIQRGPWQLSSEVIYDQYGFRQPGFDPNNIFWGRSLYFRDLNPGSRNPLTGVGYYVNLNYQQNRWFTMLNYGSFFPQQKLGVVAHDTPIHRGLVKSSYHFSRCFETYGVVLIENSVPLDATKERRGVEIIAGCQFSL